MNATSQSNKSSSPFTVELLPRWESIGQLAQKPGWGEDDGNAVADVLVDFAPGIRMIAALADRDVSLADIQARVESALSTVGRPDGVDRVGLASRLTIEIACAYLSDTTSASVADFHLLNLATLAYFPPSIEASLLPAAALTLDSPALKPFLDLKVLRAEDDALWFDPLLQHAMRCRMAAKANYYGFIVALAGVARSLAVDKQVTDAVIDAAYAVLGHSLELAGKLPAKVIDNAIALSTHFAKYEEKRSSRTAGRELTRLTIALQDRRDSADDGVGITYSNFARTLKRSGDLTGARDALRRSVEIGQSALGADHAKVGSRLAKLGAVLKDLGELDDARQAYAESVRIGESTLEAEPEIAEIIDLAPQMSMVLAEVYGDAGAELSKDLNGYAAVLLTFDDDSTDATRCQVLAERLHDGLEMEVDQAEEITELLFAYALHLRREGSLDEGRRVLRRVVDIRERAPEGDEQKLGRTLASYVMLLQQIGDVDATRDAADRLTAIQPVIHGALLKKKDPSGPVTPGTFSEDDKTSAANLATRYEYLAQIERELGDVDGYIDHLARSVELTEREGRSGSQLIARVDLLATAYRQADQLVEACTAYERAVGIAERIAPTSPEQANRLEVLATLRKQSGDLQSTIAALMKAVSVDEAGGRTNTKAGTIRLNNLARALESANDLRQAEAVYERALRAASYDSRDMPLRTVLNNFALMLRNKGDLDTAAWYAKRAVDLDRSSNRPPDAGVANRLANAAIILYDKEDYHAAAAAFEEARSIRVFLYGDDDATAKALQERHDNAQEMASNRTAKSGDVA